MVCGGLCMACGDLWMFCGDFCMFWLGTNERILAICSSFGWRYVHVFRGEFACFGGEMCTCSGRQSMHIFSVVPIMFSMAIRACFGCPFVHDLSGDLYVLNGNPCMTRMVLRACFR